jgi:hypothetical protein
MSYSYWKRGAVLHTDVQMKGTLHGNSLFGLYFVKLKIRDISTYRPWRMMYHMDPPLVRTGPDEGSRPSLLSPQA